MNKGISSIWIALLILAVVFLSIGGYYVYYKNDLRAGIPERPVSKLIAIEAIEGDFNRGDIIQLSITYNTAPPPEDFDKEFLSKISEGVLVEAHGVEYSGGRTNYKEKNVIGKLVKDTGAQENTGVFIGIGNSPDWRSFIKIVQ